MSEQASKAIYAHVERLIFGSFGRLLCIRVVVMGTNFLSNLLIARELISRQDIGVYGSYAIGIALTFFLPIMDFGLGQSIFNHYSKQTFESKNSQVFIYIFRKLVIVATIWILILLIFASTFHQTFDTLFELERNQSSSQLILLTLSIYLLSIPFSIGFRFLHSIPRIDIALLIQSSISPATLIAIIILSENSSLMMFAILTFPAVLYLLTCVIAFFMAMKTFTRVPEVFLASEVKQLRIFQIGSWSTLLALSSVLLTFSPRIFFQANRQSLLLDKYSLFMTYLLPLMSIVSLFALNKNPEYRRIQKSYRFEWLALNTKKTLILSAFLGLVFLACSFVFKAIGIPVININLQIYLFLILLFYGAYFLPLSAQSDYSTLRKFALILFLLNCITWALMSFNLVNSLDGIIFASLLVPAIVQTIVVWIQNFSNLRTFATQELNQK